jgi:hypothetical protein
MADAEMSSVDPMPDKLAQCEMENFSLFRQQTIQNG